MLGTRQGGEIGVFLEKKKKKQKNYGDKPLFNDQNQPFFQKADLGNSLGIKDVKNNFKDFSSQYTRSRLDLKGVGLTPSIGRTKNPHDIFINLDGSIKMAVRSKNPRQLP